MDELIIFSLIVGIGSTWVLDLWSLILFKGKGIAPTDWGMVGRWLAGLPRGEWILDQQNRQPPLQYERISGWLFHYLVGIIYAALLVLIGGDTFMHTPTLLPILLIGIGLSTLAGVTLFMPAMGAGFCGNRLPQRRKVFCNVLISHTLFALGQWVFALLYASWGG